MDKNNSLGTSFKQTIEIPNIKSSWKSLDKSQKVSLVSLFALLVFIPLFLFSTLNQTFYTPRAQAPVTPPDPTPTPFGINWLTSTVSLRADSLMIKANRQTFVDQMPDTLIHSDPGDPTYTTLEAAWTENNQEMRLYMYFAADNADWWVSEIRTYGASNGSWIYYTQGAPYFKTPLGQTFTGNVNLKSDTGYSDKGGLLISNMQLIAFPGSINPPPTFTTTLLPNAQVGVFYETTVYATDLDEGDTLYISSPNLPDWLNIGPCSFANNNGSTQASCVLSGTPSTRARSNITFTVTDAQGASDTKTLRLQVL